MNKKKLSIILFSITVVVYLLISLITKNWPVSWLIFIIALFAYGAICNFYDLLVNKDNNTTAPSAIKLVIFVLLTIFFFNLTSIIFGVYSFFNNDFSFSTFNMTEYDDEDYTTGGGNVEADNIDTLDINWISGSVYIEPYSGEDIIIEETCASDISDDLELRYIVDNNKLVIEFCKPFERTKIKFDVKDILKNGLDAIFDDYQSKNLTIYIPPTQTALLENISINSTSADIYIKADTYIEDLYNEDFDSDYSSLNFYTEDYNSDYSNLDFLDVVPYYFNLSNLDINDTSGSIVIDNLNCEDASINSVSSDITLNNANITSLQLNSVSAEIKASGTFKDVSTETVSGDITIDNYMLGDKIDIDTVSGNIKLSYPQNYSYTEPLYEDESNVVHKSSEKCQNKSISHQIDEHDINITSVNSTVTLLEKGEQ